MTHKLIIVFASAIILFSCKTNSSSDKTNTSEVKSTAAETNNAEDENLSGINGSFIYTINGIGVNAATNGSGSTSLFIDEVSNDAVNGMLIIEVTIGGNNVFEFEIANSGTTALNYNSHPPSGFWDKKSKGADYMDGKTGKSLYPVSVTITITSIHESRVSGTFSGTFKADQGDGGATANITDGSFNLPFVKS